MFAKTFEAGLSNLSELLNKKRIYRIPPYQRQYAWPTDKVDTLWDNLIGRQMDDQGDDGEYLLGSIVTITKDDDVADVIDGQQRLISLTLMYCAIRDSLKTKCADLSDGEFEKILLELISDINRRVVGQSEPFINLRDNNDAQLFSTICRGEYKNGRGIHANKAFRRNYIEFQKRFDALYDDLDLANHSVEGITRLAEIVSAVTENVCVVDVRITNEDDAQQIFEALNSTGEPLTQTDLIKNHVLQTCPDLEQSWESAFAQFEDELKRNPKKADDWVYYSMLSRNYRRGNGSKKDGDVAKKKMYKAVASIVKNKAAAKNFVEDLKVDLSIIHKLENPDETDDALNHMLYGLGQVGAIYFRRPLIAAARCWSTAANPNAVQLTDPRTVQLIECLLKFFFMYRTVCRMDIDKLRALSRELTIEIRNNGKDVDVSHLCEMALKLVYSRDGKDDLDAFHKRFCKEFVEQDYTADAAKYVFLSIEWELQKKGGNIPSRNGLNVEHVFPQRGGAAAWPNRAELEDFKDRLGNLTLLPEKWNIALRNHSFEAKKVGRKDDGTPITLRGKKGKDDDGRPVVVSYEKSGLLINNYFKKCTEWTPDKIEDRERSLLEYAEKIWNLREYSGRA